MLLLVHFSLNRWLEGTVDVHERLTLHGKRICDCDNLAFAGLNLNMRYNTGFNYQV